MGEGKKAKELKVQSAILKHLNRWRCWRTCKLTYSHSAPTVIECTVFDNREFVYETCRA